MLRIRIREGTGCEEHLTSRCPSYSEILMIFFIVFLIFFGVVVIVFGLRTLIEIDWKFLQGRPAT